MSAVAVRVRPLTPGRWADFERLFGARGACGGCWCMVWKLRRSAFERGKGAPNRRAMQRRVVEERATPGLLAYVGRRAVGWCAIEPRSAYPALARSRILAPVDGEPVWSIACFFVEREQRGRGVSVALLEGAVAYVARRGGGIIEGYPTDPGPERKLPAAFVWTGLTPAFARAGFTEVARRSAKRPVMRRTVSPR